MVAGAADGSQDTAHAWALAPGAAVDAVIDVVRYVLAAVALWLALRGIWRLWRGGLRLTPAPVVHAVIAGGALGLSLWLAVTPAPAAADTAGDVLQWLAEQSGLAGLWESLVHWATQRFADAVDALLESFGLG